MRDWVSEGIRAVVVVRFTWIVKTELVTQSCPTLCNPMDDSPPGSLCSWTSSGKNTGVGSHSLLQEIFLNQGLNLGLPHYRQILYRLSHQGTPIVRIGLKLLNEWIFNAFFSLLYVFRASNILEIVSPSPLSSGSCASWFTPNLPCLGFGYEIWFPSGELYILTKISCVVKLLLTLIFLK